MLERTQRSVLVFSRLLQNRRKYLSYLSALGMSVDLHTDENGTVHAAHATNHLVMVDLKTSEWEISTWLEHLRSGSQHTEAIFVTNDEQSDAVETFTESDNDAGGQVAYYCTSENILFHNSGGEIIKILELFASVA